MAPPQNSTLINDDIESITSELSRLSPIMNSSISNSEFEPNMDEELLNRPFGMHRYNSDEEAPRRKKVEPSSEAEEDEEENYEDDGEEEIPIWIGKEPRFVSGITANTTCAMVIQALIDDELANGKNVDSNASRDANDYFLTENWRDVEQVLENDTLILGLWQAWGNMKNEVQFRLKINKQNSRNGGSRDSKKTKRSSKSDRIGVINKLLKKIVHQGEVIQSHLIQLTEKNSDRRNREKLKTYFKSKQGKQMIMENFLRDSTLLSSIASDSFERVDAKKFENEHFFAKYHKYSTLPRNFSNRNKRNREVQELIDPKWNFNRQMTEDEDEIFLVIENKNSVMTSDNDSGVFIAKKQESKMTISDTPKRKHRSSKDYECVKKHLINQTHANQATPQEFTKASFRFDLIRQEIHKKMQEMEQLLEQEKSLLNKIHEKSILYQTENSLYNSNVNFLKFDIEIDDIQKRLRDCANDIILDEKELFNIKIKVDETSKTLDYLKTVMVNQQQADNHNDYDNYNSNNYSTNNDDDLTFTTENQIQFVNNFDEFCDNNESIIV